MTIIHGVQRGQTSLATKVVITCGVGALSFPLTNVIFSSSATQFAMTAAVGAVVLVVQFLFELEHRLGEIERELAADSALLRRIESKGASYLALRDLIGHLRRLGLTRPARPDDGDDAGDPDTEHDGYQPDDLVLSFVQRELDRTNRLFEGLVQKKVLYDGEDRDWLLSLTHSARASIDAISTQQVDAAGAGFGEGFWNTDLGNHYLTAQHEAVKRGVRVRRMFIVDDDDMVADAQLRELCRRQLSLGIEVRVLRPSRLKLDLPADVYDFILFDDVLSYEMTPAMTLPARHETLFQSTTLELAGGRVQERRQRYDKLWELAEGISDET